MTSIETVGLFCRERLRRPELQKVAGALAGMGLGPAQCVDLLRRVTELPASQEPVVRLRQRLLDAGAVDADGYDLERYLLLLAALESLPRVSDLPTGEEVRVLVAEAFAFLAEPDDRSLARFRCGGPDFASMSKVATLRRFPAGQFEWEVSGFPRSCLLKVRPGSLPALLRILAFEVGGFQPLIFPHFAACGPRRIVLREDEVKRSFHRMAVAMRMQPAVRGFLAVAWFLSPDALRISPHLSWLLPIFTENGGFVTTMGPAELGERLLATKPDLRRQYEQGEFRPRMGVVLWPRKPMLEWAYRNPAPGSARHVEPLRAAGVGE